MPQPDYEAARAVFGERELVDLTSAIGLMNTYNRLAISFRNTPQAVREAKQRERTWSTADRRKPRPNVMEPVASAPSTGYRHVFPNTALAFAPP